MSNISDAIKVVQVGPFEPDSPNGVKRVIYGLANLLRNDFEVHSVSMTAEEPGSFIEKGVHVHRFGAASAGGFKLPAQLLQWLDANRSGVIFHLHSVFDPRNYAFAKALVSRNIPYIFTPHDSYSTDSLRTSRLAKYAYLRTFEKYVLANAAAIHALTDEGAIDIAAYTKNTQIITIRNFVPDPAIGERLSQSSRSNTLVCVGRLDIFQKGLDRLLRIMAASSLRHRDLELHLVGPGDTKPIREIMKKTGLSDEAVHIHGRLDERSKRKILNSAMFYVQASRFEGFGLSIVESLALGLPVIVSSSIPIADTIVEWKGGEKFSTAEEAVSILDKLLQVSDEQYLQMRQAARSTFEACFSESSVHPSYVELYQSALE